MSRFASSNEFKSKVSGKDFSTLKLERIQGSRPQICIESTLVTRKPHPSASLADKLPPTPPSLTHFSSQILTCFCPVSWFTCFSHLLYQCTTLFSGSCSVFALPSQHLHAQTSVIRVLLNLNSSLPFLTVQYPLPAS